MASPRAKKAPARVAIPQLSWAEITPAPVILVSGPETFLAERAIRRVRDLLKETDASLEVHDIDAAGYAPGELATVASPSLFGEPRLIRVAAVEKSSDLFLEEMIEYLAFPADDCTVVLRHGGGVRGKKLLEAIRAGSGSGIEIICAELKKETERYEFAAAEFSSAKRRVTPGALRALVMAFADDLAELSSACVQLMSDAAEEITEETVSRYYSGRVEANAFAVADAAIAGRYGEALGLARHALASGADPVPMLAAFAMKLRTMAKVMGTRGPSGQLASSLGMAPWQVDRARRDLNGWTGEGLGRCIQILAETDEIIKGAGRDPVFAIERMIGTVARHGE